MPISSVSASASAVRSVSPTVQPTAKNQEKASTNRTTKATAEYPHAQKADQALRGSLTITTVPTLATAALVGLSSLPVAGAQGVNQQMATLTGITNVLVNATAKNEAQIEKLTSVTVANAVQTAANSCQLTTLTNITTVNSVQLEMLQNLTTVMLQLRAEDREDNALTRRAGEASATRMETALARIELIACFALAVAVLLCIPQVRAAISKAILSIPNAIRAIPNAINSAIRQFSPSTPMPPVQLNVVAAAEKDIEAEPNTRTANGTRANQPLESGDVAINLDASSHSSHASNSGEEKEA